MVWHRGLLMTPTTNSKVFFYDVRLRTLQLDWTADAPHLRRTLVQRSYDVFHTRQTTLKLCVDTVGARFAYILPYANTEHFRLMGRLVPLQLPIQKHFLWTTMKETEECVSVCVSSRDCERSS